MFIFNLVEFKRSTKFERSIDKFDRPNLRTYVQR